MARRITSPLASSLLHAPHRMWSISLLDCWALGLLPMRGPGFALWTPMAQRRNAVVRCAITGPVGCATTPPAPPSFIDKCYATCYFLTPSSESSSVAEQPILDREVVGSIPTSEINGPLYAGFFLLILHLDKPAHSFRHSYTYHLSRQHLRHPCFGQHASTSAARASVSTPVATATPMPATVRGSSRSISWAVRVRSTK